MYTLSTAEAGLPETRPRPDAPGRQRLVLQGVDPGGRLLHGRPRVGLRRGRDRVELGDRRRRGRLPAPLGCLVDQPTVFSMSQTIPYIFFFF